MDRREFLIKAFYVPAALLTISSTGCRRTSGETKIGETNLDLNIDNAWQHRVDFDRKRFGEIVNMYKLPLPMEEPFIISILNTNESSDKIYMATEGKADVIIIYAERFSDEVVQLTGHKPETELDAFLLSAFLSEAIVTSIVDLANHRGVINEHDTENILVNYRDDMSKVRDIYELDRFVFVDVSLNQNPSAV